MPADQKKPAGGDVQMKEAQESTKKDASGDVEMGDVTGDKKDDEKAEEDPAVTTANGTHSPISARRRLQLRQLLAPISEC